MWPEYVSFSITNCLQHKCCLQGIPRAPSKTFELINCIQESNLGGRASEPFLSKSSGRKILCFGDKAIEGFSYGVF